MHPFEQSVLETVRQYDMIAPGHHVVVGLSGGADSTCLLLVLHALQEELGCTLSAVHVHHGLRASADHDADYCRDLCDQLGIAFRVVRADAAEYAAAHGESVEEAGRSIRYAAFREALAEQEQGRIATAHHREDLAETVLFQLCRGSGLAGLIGIRPVKGDVIRPLLYQSRPEIEAYLRESGLTWCEDETNTDTEITRNYLRLEILPGLESHVNQGTVSHLVRLSSEAAETEAYLAEQTTAALRRCIVGTDADVPADGDPVHLVLSVDALCREPAILQRRIIHRMLVLAAGRSKDLAAVHVQAVLAICRDPDGSARVNLPYGLTAVRTYHTMTIMKADGTNAVRETGSYRMRVFCLTETAQDIPRGLYTKWFDYDRIGAFPVLRTRERGDEITIGGGVTKTLRRFMIDDKIPRDLRDSIVIPFVGNQALWIPGHQINAAFRVTRDTRRILEITYLTTQDNARQRHE